ncbi:6881_t:CDS:2 [Funneliformis mosseae]|uniref:6881_t:CDS:1 n=1 Tax=Funneliformis mosseae TaxID=27381 RepID=A0A9N9CFB4_FUNMO|nr:6881_t:CDS:2 [Funneliformis mosseae]
MPVNIVHKRNMAKKLRNNQCKTTGNWLYHYQKYKTRQGCRCV